MKEKESQQVKSQQVKSQQVKTFDTLDLQHDKLGQFRDQFFNSYKIEDQFYMSHPNLKILCSYIFFAFVPSSTTNKKIQNALQKSKATKQQLELNRNKFYIEFKQDESITAKLKTKSNVLVHNKILLQEFSRNLTEEECVQLIKSGFGSVNINVQLRDREKTESLVPKPNSGNHIVLLVEKGTNYACFFSDQKSDSMIESEIKTDVEPQKQTKKVAKNSSESKIQIRSSSDQEGIYETSKVRKVKSHGEQLDPQGTKPLETNQVTWFEVAVVLIIIFTLLSEYFGIFDPFLREFNVKVGKYHLIDTSYKAGKYLIESIANKTQEL